MRSLIRNVVAVAGSIAVVMGAAGVVMGAAGAAPAKAEPLVLAFKPSSHSYGSNTVGKKASQVFTLTNSGGTV